MRTWFQISAKQSDQKVGSISIHDEIGFWGVTAKDFIQQFQALAPTVDSVELSINSPGGSVFDGLAIYNVLANAKKADGSRLPVNVMVAGIAASAASLIAMAGTKISMPENTFMMIHNPMGVQVGNSDDMRDMADILDKIGASISTTYVKRTGQTPEAMAEMLSKDTYMTAAEAKDKGFADEVIEAKAVTAKFEADALPKTVQAAFKAAQPAAFVAAEPAPVVKPPVVVQTATMQTVVEIEAAATKAGFPEFAASWALDSTIADAADPKAALEARIAVATEVKALCILCKKPEAAPLFIGANTPMKDVRAKLIDSQASADEAQTIDAALKITKPGATTKVGATQAEDITASIWTKRKART